MKKKAQPKKALELSTERVRNLDDNMLKGVVGGNFESCPHMSNEPITTKPPQQ